MGCGDDVLNVATGGLSGTISTGDPIGSFTGAVTGGLTSLTGGSINDPLNLIGGDVRKLMDATSDSILSAGVTNIIAASKYKNFANQMDVLADPSRVQDKWVRETGEWLEYLPAGHEVRQIAPMVGAIVGGVFAGPAGSAGGYYFGNKIKGGTNEQGLIGAALSGAGSALGTLAAPAASGISASLAPTIGQTAGNIVGQGVVQGAIGAGMGAAGAAATGNDIGQGALYGGVGGAAGGAISAGISPVNSYLQQQGVNPTVANALSKGLSGLTTGAVKSGISGQDIGYGSMLGGVSGAVSGAATDLSGNKNIGTLASGIASQGLKMLTASSPTVRQTISPNALQRASISTVPRTIVPETLGPVTRSIIENRLQQALQRRVS